jgi:hypothetical protein
MEMRKIVRWGRCGRLGLRIEGYLVFEFTDPGRATHHISREDVCDLFLSSRRKCSRPSTLGCLKPAMGQDRSAGEKRIDSKRNVKR